MVSRAFLVQFNQAKPAQIPLQLIAADKPAIPNGLDKTRTAGLKMAATATKAMVIVSCVPVGFCWGSNMATSRLLSLECLSGRTERRT